MSKAVVYSLMAAAFLTFLSFAPGNNRRSRLSRRMFHNQTFDPLVFQIREAKYAHIDQDQPHRNNNSWEEDDDENLDTTLRLMVLFPLIDRAPVDGSITAEELHAWNLRRALDSSRYTSLRQMAARDINADGAITFSEFLPHLSPQEIEKKGMGHGEAGWWMIQFNNADADSNGLLDLHEFNDLMHPEDSKNGKIHRWLLAEKMKRMDLDGDGKLNLREFVDQAYGNYRSYAEFEADDVQQVPTAEEKFVHLDLNADKYLEVDELREILEYLYPGEVSHAKYYTVYLMNQVDDNKDGRFSLEEMLNHHRVFYNTIYDDEDDDYSSDEL